MACIIPKEGAIIDEEEIKEYVRTHMAKHKTPSYVKIVDSFPMNAAGKSSKNTSSAKPPLRSWAWVKLQLSKPREQEENLH